MELQRILIGLAWAFATGVIGIFFVAGVEIIVAYRTPSRREAVRHRTWRENLHHMLF
jgi:cbb3-type cytochrome oxidase subunit 3